MFVLAFGRSALQTVRCCKTTPGSLHAQIRHRPIQRCPHLLRAACSQCPENQDRRIDRERRLALAGSIHGRRSFAPRPQERRQLDGRRRTEAQILAGRSRGAPADLVSVYLGNRGQARADLRQSIEGQRRARHQRARLFLSWLQRDVGGFPRCEDRPQRVRAQSQHDRIRVAQQARRNSPAASPSTAPGASTTIFSTRRAATS